jgi:hypothetical protein
MLQQNREPSTFMHSQIKIIATLLTMRHEAAPDHGPRSRFTHRYGSAMLERAACELPHDAVHRE